MRGAPLSACQRHTLLCAPQDSPTLELMACPWCAQPWGALGRAHGALTASLGFSCVLRTLWAPAAAANVQLWRMHQHNPHQKWTRQKVRLRPPTWSFREVAPFLVKLLPE